MQSRLSRCLLGSVAGQEGKREGGVAGSSVRTKESFKSLSSLSNVCFLTSPALPVLNVGGRILPENTLLVV